VDEIPTDVSGNLIRLPVCLLKGPQRVTGPGFVSRTNCEDPCHSAGKWTIEKRKRLYTVRVFFVRSRRDDHNQACERPKAKLFGDCSPVVVDAEGRVLSSHRSLELEIYQGGGLGIWREALWVLDEALDIEALGFDVLELLDEVGRSDVGVFGEEPEEVAVGRADDCFGVGFVNPEDPVVTGKKVGGEGLEADFEFSFTDHVGGAGNIGDFTVFLEALVPD
jgi:hypothetical protein